MLNKPSRVVVILSGGIDSSVLLTEAVREGHRCLALAVDYGQRHRKELLYAENLCTRMHVPLEIADLTGIVHLLGGSSQTSQDIPVPLGHYAEESMKATVVPNRNMIMLSVAVGYAISSGSTYVLYGAHSGDHPIYPDCRPEFVQALAKAVTLADWSHIQLEAPYSLYTKAEIVARGAAMGVDFGSTWSCYQGGAKHCGECGTCVERREAFQLAGVPDPTEYRLHGEAI